MFREQVNSSSLVSLGYDEEDSILEAEFASGSVYRYLDVPEDVFTDLMAAPSKGQFFNAQIRGAFPVVQVR